ncbi:transmembrane protein 120 homolog isoform X1 [Panicum hallii]|uniref:transmembrane protein 120 homolog isoform X1 n=1 Tax=Panicum hallii TaxID=206008 RepID=UPI000DF4DEC1|nr:transmembrane protein 120 homolog isoform X1 [Panicum hallii]XP_025809055.1 transmembrane protein 120 homolog isoform X1 [Panicum hallii]
MAWLLFLYTSFALRENVLIVNGSDIRPWWIYHHYLAMVMALVSLTWEIKGQPDCYSKQKGVELFLRWAIMQGIAMHLQNRYQRQRLRTRIALGKAKRMDVVAGETAGVEGQLLLLYPVLFVLQGFEAYVGVLLLQTALHGLVAGCFLRDLAGDNGSGQLRQHYGDTDTKIEVQSEDEESKEQAGSPSSKLMKYHK